jgi:glycosyltransferase involved in cell wall biosynthesis
MGSPIPDQTSLLYLTPVDISRTNGEAITEREWIAALLEALRDRVRVILPRPGEDLAELHDYRVLFAPPYPDPASRALARYHRQAVDALSPEVLGDLRPDLLVARPGLYPWAVRDLARRTGLPLALKSVGARVTDLPPARRADAGLRARLHGLLRHPAHWGLMRGLMQRAAAVDTYTEELSRRLRRRYALPEGRLRTISDGVNVARFRPWHREEARRELGMELAGPVIGLVGTHPASQGGSQLMALVAHLRAEYPNIRALVLGGDSDAMHKLARRQGVAAHCELPGLVPYEALPRYINAMDLGLVLQPSNRSEAVGGAFQKIRQFIACGRPVVAAAQGNEFLQQAKLGSLVGAEDLKGQARAVRAWVEMPPPERREWTQYAVDYAGRHLSTRRALADRLAFWQERLGR